MDRLRAIASFALIAASFLVGLRLLHLTIPIFYPKVLSGPFSLDQIELVEQYTGFSPRLPFYRPQQLGERPVTITVTRRPYPKVVIFWQAEHFLYLAEQQGGDMSSGEGGGEPLADQPESGWRREGKTHHVVVQMDDLWIELRTDLSSRDVQRIIDTLRPYEELL
jgi:hypothetical protein